MNFKNLKTPSNKNFGIIFSLIFFLISIYFFFKNTNLFIFSLIISVSFFSLSILKPSLLKPLNKSWMFIGYILSLIVSPIVFGIIFFIMITPISLLRKIFGKDELRLKDNSSKSFWIYNNFNDQSQSDFKNQF